MNLLYQTREVSQKVWDENKERFISRVCELVGVPFDRIKRPTSQKYLEQLDVIRRLTQSGKLRTILDEYVFKGDQG